MFAGLNLGIGFLIAGLVLVLVIWILIRILPRSLDIVQANGVLVKRSEPANSVDALIHIQPGG